ncbi:MAG: hypothetical protein NC911_08040 [Candidatus Omnitrophica bacterium]|nr:hypothetical protein [Candidatus Omnitrophota bacterium]
MKFKPDWEKVKQRYLAFWQGEIYDRVLLSITVPCLLPLNKPVQPEPEKRFTDTDYLLQTSWKKLTTTTWLADALPVISSDCGLLFPDCLFGAKMIYRESLWTRPTITSCKELLNWPSPRITHHLVRRQEQYFRQVGNKARNHCLVALPPITPGLDCLASVIGTERLCEEMAEDSPFLLPALGEIDQTWFCLYQHFSQIATALNLETTGYLPLWGPGKTAVFQCDFLNLISPRMFEKFALPSLLFCLEKVDHAIFHLDGIKSLNHLNTLLACEKIEVFQWQPRGPGRTIVDIEKWLPLLKKIQAARKKIYISCLPEKVSLVLKTLSSKNLFLETETRTVEEARELEKLAFKSTHD